MKVGCQVGRGFGGHAGEFLAGAEQQGLQGAEGNAEQGGGFLVGFLSKDDSIKEYLGMGMGFFARAAGFGLAFLAIWSDYRKRRDLIDMLHREPMLAFEKGLELPEIPRTLVGESPEAKPGHVSPTKGLKGGLIWLVTGLGFTLFFAFEVGRTGDGRWNGPNPALGLIPAGIGVVNLICYWVERRARGGSLKFGDSSLK